MGDSSHVTKEENLPGTRGNADGDEPQAAAAKAPEEPQPTSRQLKRWRKRQLDQTRTSLRQKLQSAQFVVVGELHNSRSGIKFLLDNLEVFLQGNNVYLLTEFLPTNMAIRPRSFRSMLRRSIRPLRGQAPSPLNNVLRQHEADRQPAQHQQYTLNNLFGNYSDAGVHMRSVETQTPGSAESRELHERLRAGDVAAFETRTEQINQNVEEEAARIWQDVQDARIVVFVGMGHAARSRSVGVADVYEAEDGGISGRFRRMGKEGVSVNTHDRNLCIKKFGGDVVVEATYSRYAPSDDGRILTVEGCDFFVWNKVCANMTASGENYDSVFLAGELTRGDLGPLAEQYPNNPRAEGAP